MALEKLGRDAEARGAFERAVAWGKTGEGEDPRRESSLGLALAHLGRCDEALVHGRRAVELYPLEMDAYVGAVRLEDLAWVEARCGRVESAVDHLERLLGMASFSAPGMLRLDLRWDPLRGDARFERLARGRASA
jgi:tetratricopeptide (TPR) repeat protein